MGYVAIPNLSSFSTAQLQAMLTAAQTETLLRMGTGRVQSGSSAAQSYGMHVMSDDKLFGLINALTDALGLDTQETRVRPCFSRQGVGSECSNNGLTNW